MRHFQRFDRDEVSKSGEISISSGNLSGTINITGLTGDTKYVVYGYTENSDGDVSNESAPVFFTTPQGKTVTPAPCQRGEDR